MGLLSRSILLSCLIPIAGTQLHCQPVAQCSGGTVVYSKAPKEIEEKMEILNVGQPVAPTSAGRRVASPQGTAYFVEVDPDYISTKVPWTTTLYVGGLGHPGVYLRASFKDHGNTFSAHWINEKMIFVQVWWGHIASSDVIIDISKGQFVYDELANYGELGEPCR